MSCALYIMRSNLRTERLAHACKQAYVCEPDEPHNFKFAFQDEYLLKTIVIANFCDNITKNGKFNMNPQPNHYSTGFHKTTVEVALSQKKKDASAKEIKCKDIQGTLQKENIILEQMLNETENMHLVYLDRDFNFVRVNEAYAKTCGYKPEEMIGINHFTLYPDEEIEAIFKCVRDTGVPVKFYDKQFVFPDQPERGITYWDWTLKPVKDENGEVKGLVFSLFETTERKKAEKEIQSLAKFPSENPSPVFRIDKNGHFLFCNDAAKRHLKGSKCDVGEVIPERWRMFVDASFASVERQEFEEQIGGRTFVFALSPVTDYVNVYGHDITERKKAEEALRESEDRLRMAQQVARVGTFEWNIQTGVNKWTPELEAMYGLNQGEFSGTQDAWEKLVYSEDRDEIIKLVSEAMEKGGFEGEWRVVWPDGSMHWIFGRAWVFKDSAGKPMRLIGINIDITERKKAEEALLRSARKYRRLYETSQDGIMARDLQGRMISCNKAYSRMLGYSKRELRTLSVHRLLPEKWRNPRDEIFKLIVETGVSKVFEREYIRKDGLVFPASVRSWPLTDDSGKIVGVWSVVRDISELKKTEEELRRAEWVSRHRAEELEVIKAKLEEKAVEVKEFATHMEELAEERASKLKDAERLAAIGTTAGMVGHDIRNPLQSISGDIYLIIKELIDLPDSEQKQKIRESLEEIDKSVGYIDKIVQDLQDFAKPLNPVAQEIDLEKVCHEVLFKNYSLENIEMSYEFQEQAKKLVADPALLKRILANLASNAVQAMPQGGKLQIKGFQDADVVVITVEDSGVGIPNEAKPKLFTPMFTTKSKGQGFGLAVVKRITEALGGTVTFKSEIGKGTKFTVRLPARARIKEEN